MADDLYREVILDHYKNPRGHGVIEEPDAQAEGLNPLCGDEVSIYVQFAEDGDPIGTALEWGVRVLQKPVTVHAEGDRPEPATADIFPAYDDDGGLLVALTPR